MLLYARVNDKKKERTLEIFTIGFQMQTLLSKNETKAVWIGAVNSYLRGQWQLEGPANSTHTDRQWVSLSIF
jgi:hypothetical protein